MLNAPEVAEAELVDLDAEFSDHPALNDSVEKPSPVAQIRKASSGDFELPAESPPAPAAPVDDGGAGAIDWDAAAILQDDDNATRGIPKDASLSAIMRELADDSSEMSTRPPAPVAPTVEREVEDSTPMVTVDWVAGSVEGPAVSEAQAQEAKATPAKPKDKGKGREPERERDWDQDETKVKAKEKGKDREKKVAPPLDSDDSEETPKAKAARGKVRKDDSGEKTKPAKKGGGMLVGLLVGGVLAGGAAAGVYLSGIIPNSEKQTTTTQKPPEGGQGTGQGTGEQNNQQPPPQTHPAANDAGVALATGDITKALELVKAKPAATTEEKAVAGSVRVFAKLQELGKSGAATAAADDADLTLARADLKAVVDDPEATKSAAAEKRSVAAMV